MSDLAQTSYNQSWRIYFSLKTVPFWSVHIAAIVGVILLGWSFSGLAIAIGSYYARMFFVTAGHHRYFSHRAYKTSRVFQFLLAVGASCTVQKGIFWWAAHHRNHHRYSDGPKDPHSPIQSGFWWSHLGWILSQELESIDYDRVRDLTKYPELRWAQRYHLLLAIAFAVALFFVGGAHALVWGFFVSTVLLWHGTFTINSLAHVIGRRRYNTGDDSRNHFGLALLTMGEGWHNNHHHYQSATCQGFRWYEIDATYYILRLLSVFHIVWDLRRPPQHIVAGVRKPSLIAPRPVATKRAA